MDYEPDGCSYFPVAPGLYLENGDIKADVSRTLEAIAPALLPVANFGISNLAVWLVPKPDYISSAVSIRSPEFTFVSVFCFCSIERYGLLAIYSS